MSISQLDDPAMRTALGIETDDPSQLTSPVQIGSVTLTAGGGGNLLVGNNVTATNVTANTNLVVGGLQLFNAGGNTLAITDLNTQTGGGLRVGGFPVNGIAQLSETALSFTQLNTGTTTTVLSYDQNDASPTTETVVLNNIRTINSTGGYPLTISSCGSINAENPNTSRTNLLVAPFGTTTLDGTEQQLNVAAYNLVAGKTYGCWGQAYLTWGAPPVATDKVYFIFRTSSQVNAFDDPNANTRWTIYPEPLNTAGLLETYVSFAGTFVADANSTLRISVLGAVGTPADYTADFTNLAIQRLD